MSRAGPLCSGATAGQAQASQSGGTRDRVPGAGEAAGPRRGGVVPYGWSDEEDRLGGYLSRTVSALMHNVDRIAEGCGWVYLWTFTRVEADPVAVSCVEWNKLSKRLVRECGLYGVRVYELHPGGHGLHVHLVTGRRFDVGAVRAVVDRLGWGRLDVKRVPWKRRHYVAKYVTKAARAGELAGRRLWATLGRGPCERVRCQDVAYPVDPYFEAAKAEGWYREMRARRVPAWRLLRLLKDRAWALQFE